MNCIETWHAGDMKPDFAEAFPLNFSPPVNLPFLIAKKRDGGELSDAEISGIIRDFTAGTVPDHQMSALTMAIYFRGMTPRETAALTQAMMESGDVLQYPANSPPKVDKHSTGGVGDKVSLVLAPLLACEGLWVPMISGRGLGITGGTLDKLESIPGFRTDLDQAAALRQLEKIGVFMIGQTDRLCPADRKLYALRDVTATVPSRPLIVASIMSKKLAENLDRLVLDVKHGSGAFMKNREDAILLASELAEVGRAMDVEVSSVISPMDQPLGRTAGNALEVIEAVETLQGRGPADLRDLVLDLARRVCPASREDLAGRLHDGSAWERFVSLVDAQGGDAASLERPIHAAPFQCDLRAPHAGVVASADAGIIGSVVFELGAGRRDMQDAVDPAVGCSAIAKIGEFVEKDAPLVRIHARTQSSLFHAEDALRCAFQINSQP